MRLHRSSLVVAVVSLALAACTTGSPPEPPQPGATPAEPRPTAGPRDVEADIARIESTLTSPVQIAGKEPETFSLAERMAYHHVPGVSAAYFDDGEIVWVRTWGVSDARTGRPLTTETLFQASGISKPVAAVGMLTMVDEGLVELHTDVNQYLRSWSVPEGEMTADQPVTLALIAAHGAGFNVVGFEGYDPAEQFPTPVQVLDGAPPARNEPVVVDSHPATALRYSGGGYVVMQLLLEDQTGKPFPQLMHERLFTPLGMTQSTFEQPLPRTRAEQAATGHDLNGDPIEGRFRVYPETAAAGLWTTPSDLARFAIEAQRAHAGEEGAILSPSLAEQMLSAQIRAMGFGFNLIRRGGAVTAVRHAGSNDGFRALFMAHLDGDGIVLMANGVDGGDLLKEIFTAADQVYGWMEWEPRAKEVVQVPAEQLARYAGRFRVTQPVVADVVVEPTTSGVEIEVVGLDRPHNYYPSSETEFFDLSGDRVRFEVDEGGATTAMFFRGIRADRVD